MLKCGLVREGLPSMVNLERVNGDGQEEAQFCFERVEGRSCMYSLGVCRSSPFFRVCVGNSDKYLVAVPLVQGVGQWILCYAFLFSHVGFPRLFLFWVGEEGYNGGVLDRDPIKFVFVGQGSFDSGNCMYTWTVDWDLFLCSDRMAGEVA